MSRNQHILFALAIAVPALQAAIPPKPPEQEINRSGVFLVNQIVRPLRYTPVGTDFVITNGGEYFNRPLYGGNEPLRVDAGDIPEFSIYDRGRGGNLRLGFRVGNRSKWMHEADTIVAAYRPGAMVYQIRDSLLGDGVIELEAIGARSAQGMILRADVTDAPGAVDLLLAFGGVNGMRGRRNGDIGCESEPVSKFFQLRPEQCQSNEVGLAANLFAVRGRNGVFGGLISGQPALAIADASNWVDSAALFEATNPTASHPVVIGDIALNSSRPTYLGLCKFSGSEDAEKVMNAFRDSDDSVGVESNIEQTPIWKSEDLVDVFDREEEMRRNVANRVQVETPDPYINAAAAALNVAADGVWDDRQQAFMHGGVAWRVRLLGWRVSYAGDALGWHDRTAKHFAGFAREQNTNPIPREIPAPEESANLSRNENALHSNGNMTSNHYDMNLVGVDAFFRHLLWTGDLEFAEHMWPVLERHFAWERRLFRREYGPHNLPLYEAYAAIWASDDLAYNGGGATHSSAYNLYHNRMMARLARSLGKDPTPYEQEAALIAQGMQEYLWLGDRGWYAEWKDLLGEQLVHPNPAVWTFYHTMDSKVPTPFEAWQMMEFVKSQNPQFPVYGPGVPEGNYTIATSRWMPYTWSLNNVVMAESMHTALAYWQAGRSSDAYPLFKGAILDSMYLGLCPGNVGMCTFFDANRRESQRDFGDGVGATSRSLIEGLFGFRPDLLAGVIYWRPGFPSEWDNASISHPDFDLSFNRDNRQERFEVTSRFAKPVALRLQIPALADRIDLIFVNGQRAKWILMNDAVGQPCIEIDAPAAGSWKVLVQWDGDRPASPKDSIVTTAGELVESELDAEIINVLDPQEALTNLTWNAGRIRGIAIGTEGHRTVFAKLKQGQMEWWQPLTFEIISPSTVAPKFDWSDQITGELRPVNLNSLFNAQVTEIFQNDYLSPRSPHCSLATPKQGIGSWCHPHDTFEVDDSGLRSVAAASGGQLVMPNGVSLQTPVEQNAPNVIFVSQWDNYPTEVLFPLEGRASRAFLLMAGSTSAMQSRFDNGEVVFTYTDGSQNRLPLHNPTTWWPIEQDYYIDDYAFAYDGTLPPRVDLATGSIRMLDAASFKGRGGPVPGGAATVLEVSLDSNKELESLKVRALANEVVVGLMSLTLQRE